MEGNQNTVLTGLKDKGEKCRVIMMNGFQMQGTIINFDAETLSVKDESGDVNLVYKHAVSTIKPAREERKPKHEPQPKAEE